MKPFVMPYWRKRQLVQKHRREAMVISGAVADMESVMKEAVDSIYSHWRSTGQFYHPTLNGMFVASERFYRRVIEQAFHSAKEDKASQKGKKKLAKGPTGIPKSMRELNQVFANRKQWPKIMKRSQILTERLRRQYIQKLKRKFEEITPKLTSGELSPEEAKTHLMSAWKASKSRVETIFRTETTNYFEKTNVAFFDGDPEIIGFLFDSVRDTSRTNVCKTRHGLVYKPGSKLLRENTPALHWQCRSHLIALANTPHNRKLLEDPERDPELKAVAPLPPGWRK